MGRWAAAPLPVRAPGRLLCAWGWSSPSPPSLELKSRGAPGKCLRIVPAAAGPRAPAGSIGADLRPGRAAAEPLSRARAGACGGSRGAGTPGINTLLRDDRLGCARRRKGRGGGRGRGLRGTARAASRAAARGGLGDLGGRGRSGGMEEEEGGSGQCGTGRGGFRGTRGASGLGHAAGGRGEGPGRAAGAPGAALRSGRGGFGPGRSQVQLRVWGRRDRR